MPFDYEFFKPAQLAAGLKGSSEEQKVNFPTITRPARRMVKDHQSSCMTTESGKSSIHSGNVSMKASVIFK